MKKIEVSCWEEEEALTVVLEPEASEFILERDNILSFVAVSMDEEFKWHIRFSHKHKSIQVYPESLQSYEIHVYKNGILI